MLYSKQYDCFEAAGTKYFAKYTSYKFFGFNSFEELFRIVATAQFSTNGFREYYFLLDEVNPAYYYFDIEFTVDDPQYQPQTPNFENIGDEAVDQIQMAFEDFLVSGDIIDELTNIQWFTSTAHRENKYSYHLICNTDNFVTKNAAQRKHIMTEFIYFVKKTDEYDDSILAKIDTCVYTKNRAFRTIYSTKNGVEAKTLYPTDAPARNLDQEVFLRHCPQNIPSSYDYFRIAVPETRTRPSRRQREGSPRRNTCRRRIATTDDRLAAYCNRINFPLHSITSAESVDEEEETIKTLNREKGVESKCFVNPDFARNHKNNSLYCYKHNGVTKLRCYGPECKDKFVVLGAEDSPIPDLLINEKYICDSAMKFVDENQDVKNFFISSPMGSGKTHFIIEYLKKFPDKSVLWIGCRVSYLIQIKTRLDAAGLDFDYYQAIQFNKDYCDQEKSKLMICYDSIHKLFCGDVQLKHFDIVVLDEYYSLITYFVSEHIPLNNRRLNLKTLIAYTKNIVEKCFLMDADLTGEIYELFTTVFINTPSKYIHNAMAASKENYVVTPTLDSLLKHAIDNIEAGNNVAFAVLNVALAHTIVDYLKERCGQGLSVLLYASTSTTDEKSTILNANEYWKDYRVVVFTPVVNMGVEFNVEGYFHAMYGIAYGRGKSCLPSSFVQMLRRIRHLVGNTIYVHFDRRTCKSNKTAELPIDSASMVAYIDILFRVRNHKLLNTFNIQDEIDDSGIWKINLDDAMTQVCIYRKILLNKAIIDYVGQFLMYATLHGGKVTFEALPNDPNIKKDIKEKTKEKRVELSQKTQTTIYQSDETKKVVPSYTMGTVEQAVLKKQGILSFFKVQKYADLAFSSTITEEFFFTEYATPEKLVMFYLRAIMSMKQSENTFVLSTSRFVKGAYTALYPLISTSRKKDLQTVASLFSDMDQQNYSFATTTEELLNLHDELDAYFVIETGEYYSREGNRRAILSDDLMDMMHNHEQWTGLYKGLEIDKIEEPITDKKLFKVFKQIQRILGKSFVNKRRIRRNGTRGLAFQLDDDDTNYPIITNVLL